MTKLFQITEKKEKLKIGVYGITGCAGCQLSVIFNEDEILDVVSLVDFKAFPFIKEVNLDQEFDYVFIEGLVADQEDLEVLEKIRKNTKFLVSLGACACTGCVPAYRQFSLKENYEHLLYKKVQDLEDIKPTPVDAHVKVDYYIPGCPPDKREIITFIKNVVMGKQPKPYESPVCVECRRNGNQCLLDLGKPCLGPITAGGCNSVCTNGGFECWGCRGPTKDMNLDLMINILKEKGFDEKFIQDRLRTFVGLKLPMLEKVLHGKDNAESHNKN
ncbi:NADH:ubiquinone oxidoreductase [Candidatus Woesearchaeota archaeon]|nr:MAG: NADH:ubiquinone oxidoreductase [Candidatus Woesearchaeota archaeon]